ncbi:unnamed protein product [Parascedosporium putredinis]|uniref:Uncharacterized protein n=1 Tax=Parascedosporium putredinis TaxID=1442378 RepID=A0A9P1MFD9_9PEZI|nr:unnamed protein product [Parascedosporium putredinis]CAI8004864.1 unnamed protein product [Parascedosporium putredinis]
MATAPVSSLEALKQADASIPTLVQTLNDAILADESQASDIVWDSWNSLLSIAGQTPRDKQGSWQKVIVEGDALWESLPTFGWVARELWNWDIHDPSATAKDYQDWNNKTAFLAHLTALSNPSEAGDAFNYSLYALWAMRSAFEEDSPRDESYVPAVRNAAIWILLAGKALRSVSSENVAVSDNTGAPGSKFSDKAWKGFSEERWAVWKEGFREAADLVKDARAAVEIMEDLH